MKKIVYLTAFCLLTSCGPSASPTEMVSAPETPSESPAESVSVANPKSGAAPTIEKQGNTFKITLNNEPQALCNDGSPAVFYFEPGSGKGVNQWVVHLEGGGSCRSLESCQKRLKETPKLMSSKQYVAPNSGLLYGILSSNAQQNPDFYQFNRVRVMYCSSDFWSGTRSANADSGGFHFQGKNIVRAVFKTLINSSEQLGVSINDADEVLFSGTSAGAAGIQHNLDEVGESLPNSLRLRGLIDSLWSSARQKIQAEKLPLEAPLSNESLNFWKHEPDQSCAQANPQQLALCNGEDLLLYFNHDVFVFIDQSDTNFNQMSAAQQQTFKRLRRQSLANVSGGFSPDQGIHGSVTNQPFFDLIVDGNAYREIIANWYFERSGSKKVIFTP